MNCEQAKKIEIVDFLARISISPQKTTGTNYWYLSPNRDEKTPSFKVNKTQNIWVDYGTGKGGKILELVMTLYNVDLSEALKIIENTMNLESASPKPEPHNETSINETKQATQTDFTIKPLTHHALYHYLMTRKIDINIAKQHCQEAHETKNGKHYFYICFKNNSGGYERRNKFNWSKGCIGNKDISILEGTEPDFKKVTVFEGFMDFLSWLTVKKSKTHYEDIIVLNGIAQANKAINFIKEKDYKKINLFLDNDTEGIKAAQKFIEIYPFAVNLSKEIYPKEKDFNDYLINSK